MDLEPVKTEVLSRLNIQNEYEALGIVFAGKPNSSGWLPCRSPYSPDKHPSCGVNISSGSYRGYLCVFNDNGSRGKPHTAHSFFDVAADFLPGAGGKFMYVLKHYAKKTGVEIGSNGKGRSKALAEEYVKKLQASLAKSRKKQLFKDRGWTEATIEKFEIGFCPLRKRFSYPVRNESGALVNIRYHASQSNQKPKTLNTKNHGKTRLWGLDRLIKAPAGFNRIYY